ncbi:MAG TPA: tetratricopeptide repeat protein, partial [bacterium]|nr:tetratricopeptide repeat protein [bacterium]
MGNGIEKDRGIQSTLWKWAEESKLPTRPVAKGTEGAYDGRQVVEFVFSHFEKFSPKIKKQIEVLQKSFRALGFSDDEAKAILAGDPKTGAKRLVERGKDFEKRAAEAKAEKKPGVAHHLLEQAKTAYRLALGVEPKDAPAHRALADLLYRQGDTKAAREEAGLAVRHADAKDIPGLIVWLHTFQDPAVKNSKGLDFVATNLIEARRFDEAKNLYEGAARAQSDKLVAQKFREKALLVEELGGAFKPTFDEKINPEVTKLHAALRAQGIPGGLMAGAPIEGKAARELNASQVLAFVDKNGEDPRVQKALKECGLAIPKMKFRDAADQESFSKLSFSQQLSLYHQRQGEAATGDKAKEKHLAAAAHFDPTSTAKLRALAEIYAGQKDPSSAIQSYRWLVKMDPANVGDRQALGKLYLSQDRWEEAYKVLPRAEAETMLTAKIDKARQFAEIKDFHKAEEIVRQVWGLLEGPYKGRAELPADEAAQILRLKANLDLAAGAVHVLKEGPAQGVQGFQQALEATNEVLQKNPKDEQALLLRARANDKLGNGKAALADYLATSTLNQSPTLVPKDVKTSTSPTLRGIPMPEDYYRFVERYREQLRTDFKKELDTFKRFAHETSGDAKQQLQASREKLEAMAVDLRAFPEMSRNDQFENLKLVREFFKYRNQWVEGQAVLKFEGQAVVDPKAPVVPANIVSLTEKWTDGNPTPDQVLEFAGAIKDKIFEAAVPGISSFQAKAKAQEEIAQRAREHKAFVNSWDYQELKVDVELELKAVEEQMREVRNELLPTLTLKDGERASLEQVGNAEVASKINMELGHLNGLTNTLDQWKALVTALPADLLDTRYRLDQYGQILAGYRMVRAADEKTYNGPALPTDMEIHDRMLSILFGRQADGSYDKDRSFNDLAEKYVKSQGLPWDEKAFSDLTSAISSNETEAVRLLNFLSADGLKDFMAKNQQAGEIMKKAFNATEGDYAGAKAIALEALRIYAQLGNSAKVEETLRYIDDWGHYGPQNDNEIAREIQNLELYSAMADAVQGTNIRLTGESKEDADAQLKYADSGKVPRTYEELLLDKARSSAGRLTGRSFGDYIPGLVAARSFYEKDRDNENVREIDKKLKEELDYSQDHLELRVQNMKNEVGKVGTSDAIVLLYSEGERQSAVSQASELMQARLA